MYEYTVELWISGGFYGDKYSKRVFRNAEAASAHVAALNRLLDAEEALGKCEYSSAFSCKKVPEPPAACG